MVMSANGQELVLSETDLGLCTITFNRPAKKNALTLEMYERTLASLTDAAGDPDVRVVLIQGSGGSFTAGNDLKDFMQHPPTSPDTPVYGLLKTLANYEKPIVAAVEGPAIGLGTTMLLHCDLVYAGSGAVFALPFVNLGLVPEAASSLLLPRMVGYQRASELLLTGDKFSAETAHQVGIVSGVYPDEEVGTRARARALELCAKPPEALRMTKRLMRDATRVQVDEAIEREGELFFTRLQSAEAREAFAAFFEKRPPDFDRR